MPERNSWYVLMNVWVFVFFVRERRWEALWSLLTVLAGALIYHFYGRHRPEASGS